MSANRDGLERSPFWNDFRDWFHKGYDYVPRPRDRHDREIFLAFAAGIQREKWIGLGMRQLETGADDMTLSGGERKSGESLVSDSGPTEGEAHPPLKHIQGCECQRCGRLYKLDIQIPNHLWDEIRPKHKPPGGGLLCGSCIISAMEELMGFNVMRLDWELRQIS